MTSVVTGPSSWGSASEPAVAVPVKGLTLGTSRPEALTGGLTRLLPVGGPGCPIGLVVPLRAVLGPLRRVPVIDLIPNLSIIPATVGLGLLRTLGALMTLALGALPLSLLDGLLAHLRLASTHSPQLLLCPLVLLGAGHVLTEAVLDLLLGADGEHRANLLGPVPVDGLAGSHVDHFLFLVFLIRRASSS